MANNLPIFTRTRSGEFPKPGLERLYEKRFRVTRAIDTMQGTSLPPELFIDYGEPDKGSIAGYPDLADLCLMEVGTTPGADPTLKKLVMVFETLTDTLVDEIAPVIDYDLNGLKRVTHHLIALPGIDLDPYDFDVGVSLYVDGELVLGQLKDESTDAATRITLVYLQPGVISKSKGAGPSSLPGTVAHTWQTWMQETPAGLPGLETQRVEENVEGFKVWTISTLATAAGASPVGTTLATYYALKEITRPGTVQVAVQNFPGGDIPYLVTQPPRQGTVRVQVVVKLEASPVVTKPTAFNLENLSVGVTSISRSDRYVGEATTVGGGVTITIRAVQARVDHDTLRGYYYTTNVANGTEYSFSYDSGAERSSDGTIVTVLTNTEYLRLTLAGSNAYTEPTAGALIDIDPEPTSVAGTGGTLYRVTYYYLAADSSDS